jgi:ubiquinone/menaquinone biosynthesis C-methylase UbiE
LGQPSPPAATAAEAPPEEGILTGAGAEKFANAMSSEGAKVYERRIATQKEELFRALDDSCSNVLEIGIGSGPNLPYYSGSVKKLTGLDPNPFMLEKLATGACKKQTSAGVVPTLVGGVGESLPFADASFDAVVSTLVLCSVTDPEKVLSEIGRVLKPGGRYLFMEHVRAEAAEDGSDGDGAAKLLAAAQDAADPMQVKMAAGCHLNRRTGDQILNSEAFERIAPMKHFSAMGDRGEQFLISPHVMGVAWKKKEAA